MGKHGKLLLSLALAAGLCAAPGMARHSCAQPQLPDSETLNRIAQGAWPGQPAPAPQAIPQKPQKPERPPVVSQNAPMPSAQEVENAARQNMQSAEFLMGAAAAAGATPKQLEAMEKASVRFIRLFLAAITPGGEQGPGNEGPKGDKPKGDKGDKGQKGDKPKGDKPRGDKPAADKNGVIFTAPDGTQWLLTPMNKDQRPAKKPGAEKRPSAAKQGQPMTPPPGCPAFKGSDGRPPMAPPPGCPAFQGFPGQRMGPGTPNFVTPDGRVAPPAPGQFQPQKPAVRPVPPQAQPMPPRMAPAPQGQPPVPPQVQPAPQPAPQAQPEIIIMEETVTDMPLWPTKEQVSKDGVLQYLEKRNAQRNLAGN